MAQIVLCNGVTLKGDPRPLEDLLAGRGATCTVCHRKAAGRPRRCKMCWRVVCTLPECRQVFDANGGLCPDCYFDIGE